MDKSKTKPLIKIFLTYLISLSLVKILSVKTSLAVLSYYRSGLIAAIWIIIPSLILMFQGKEFKAYGITLSGWKRSMKIMLMASAITLGVYFIGWYIYATEFHNKSFAPSIQVNMALLTISILLFVGIPEEYFFRGYLQSELNYIFGRKIKFLSSKFGPGLLITAIIFTLSHILVQMDWSKASLIFLSLILGWLREKTESILASVGLHTFANMTYLCTQEFFVG
jgi:hypothetical protein